MKIGILGLPRANNKPLRETIRLSEEIESLGHEPLFINYRRAAIGVTEEGRGLYQYEATGTKLWPIEVDAVIPRIGKYTPAGVIALKALELSGVPTTASSDAVRIAKDKVETQIYLDQAGVQTPYTMVPVGKLPEKPDIFLKRIQPNYRGPMLIKSATGSHGKGVTIAESRRSGRSVIDSLPDAPFMIQEFIEPSDERYHTDMRLIVIGGQVVAAMRRSADSNAEEEEFRANLSLGGKGEIYQPTQREREMAVRSTEAVGLEIAGVDIMHSYRGPLVIEVNDNLEFGIEDVTGFNVAESMARIAIDKAMAAKNVVPIIDEPSPDTT